MSAPLESIAGQQVIPVLRCANPTDAVATARAFADAGMSVVELTCTIPNVEDAIAQLRDDGLTVGLGTITSVDRVGPAVDAGASFVVSFCAPEGLVRAAHEHGAIAIPGALTPGEVAACRCAGADVIKLFPAEQLSPGYLRHLLTVMPGLRLMPTGGIAPSTEGIQPWLSAGAVAVGVGGALGTVSELGAEQAQERARRAVEAARSRDATGAPLNSRP